MNINHINLEPFQIFDVLSETDFSKVLVEKNNFISDKQRSRWTKKLNFSYNEKQIGIFSKVCDKIKESLILKGLVEPKVTSIDFLNHVERTHMPFHKHWMLEGLNPYDKEATNSKTLPYEYFWVAIYYPHNLYEKEYAGNLIVKMEENLPGYTFDSVPNSLVLHNGLYGHEVIIEKLHPTITRDACFTQWVCKRPK